MAVVGAKGTVRERLLSRIRKNERGCWIWTAANNGRYGCIYAYGRHRYAHRVAYREFNGPIPDGAHVRHRCDTPLCINPAHLLTGSKRDNMQDAVRRGRTARGERCGASKLTREQVLAIRREHPRSERRIQELCREYGVARRTIYRARSGETWTHLPAATSGEAPRGRMEVGR